MKNAHTYILTITAKRKGGKRHIVTRSTNIEYLRGLMNSMNDRYVAEIYSGSWELLERKEEA